MSKDRGALVALGMMLLAIILVQRWGFSENSGSYAEWVSAIISIAGAAVSGWAVWMAYRALELNQKATLAAVEQATVANKQFENAYRPELSLTATGPYNSSNEMLAAEFEPGQQPRSGFVGATITIENIGAITATVIKYEYLVKVDPRSRAQLQDLYVKLGAGQVWLPGGLRDRSTLLVTRENVYQLRWNPPPIIGRVEYLDPLGNRREMGFAFAPAVLWSDDLLRWGGPEYNFERILERAT